MECGAEAAQEEPITGDGPSQEPAAGCVPEGKIEFCSLTVFSGK